MIANLEVASGQVVTPSIGLTRTEADFAAHIAQTIQTDPQAAWIFITDQLNTHQSVQELRTQILAFIAYYNRTADGAFHWTYKGPPARS